MVIGAVAAHRTQSGSGEPGLQAGTGLDDETLQRLDGIGSCPIDGAREAAAFPGERVRFGGVYDFDRSLSENSTPDCFRRSETTNDP